MLFSVRHFSGQTQYKEILAHTNPRLYKGNEKFEFKQKDCHCRKSVWSLHLLERILTWTLKVVWFFFFAYLGAHL